MSTDTTTPFVSRNELAEWATRYATLFSKSAFNAPWFIAMFRQSDGALVACNQAAYRWLVPSQGALPMGYKLQDLLGVEEADLFKHHIVPQLKVFGSWTGKLVLRDVWGSEFETEAGISSDRHAGESVEYYCLQAAKMRGEARTGKTSNASDRELLHSVLETFPESVFFKDMQGRFLRVSEFMAKRFGFDNGNALVGKTDFDLYPVDQARHSYENELEIVRTRVPVVNVEEQETLADGNLAWVSVSKFPLCDREGNIAGTFGIARDITERKREEHQKRELELQMHLSQKLESIGRLASGVAHEINTPAQFITDNTQFLKKAMQPVMASFEAYRQLRDAALAGGDLSTALEKVRRVEKESRLDYYLREIPQTLEDTLEGLARVTRIVRSLKEFSHPNQSTKTLVDLNRAVETTLALSRHEWKYVATTKLELQPDLPLVPCVVDEINQVILNLIVNAAHAIEDARKQRNEKELGVITLRTKLDADWVAIEVADTGTGISDEVKAHLFEPFFTTKEVGRGTGQGLAIIRTVVVKNHGGAIFFDSELGKGTTFTVRLPLVEEDAAAAPKL